MSMLTKRATAVSPPSTSESEYAQPLQTSQPPQFRSESRGQVPRSVALKLFFFSFLLLFGPIATYFGTLNKLFNGNVNYAAAASVVVANVVVFSYVIAAILEDKDTFGGHTHSSDDSSKKTM